VESGVSIDVAPPVRYRSRESEVTLPELDGFIERSIAELSSDTEGGAPFAVFYGEVNDATRSRVEVGVPARDGDRVLEGGYVVHARARGATDYEAIHRVYDAIKDFIVANGLRQNGPTREVYHGRDRFSDEIEVVWPVEQPQKGEADG
jgi:effector-binding domain-containing protein